MTKKELLFELKNRNINVIQTAKRDELIRELELALMNDTKIMQKGKKKIYKNCKLLEWNTQLQHTYYLFYSKMLLKNKETKILHGKKICFQEA